ncbi:hypothetical protein G4B88_014772 [Cannabis sativa]|uniref:Uncharacterized protein n=1 Tax=Cannabis sativa TaxID=3483 RepID=A0A7J6IAJ7_CANSA|nr:hypothetical protein G4B88_014772 [Cannabis sativa]
MAKETNNRANFVNVKSLEWIGCLFTRESITLCCQFSLNWKYLASAGYAKKIFVWDVGTLSSQSTLTAHSSFITDIRFQPNSSIFASSSFDGTVKKIWDATRPKKFLSNLVGHSRAVSSLDFQSNNTLFSCDITNKLRNGIGFSNTQTRNVVFTKKSLKLWNDIGPMRTSFEAHGGNVRALAESKETNMIASVGDDQCVNLWKGKSTNARKDIKADSHTKKRN